MASIRERIDASGKKNYHVQIRLQGFPPQTKTFDNKTVAEQWAQRVETELREGRYMTRALAQRRTVQEMLETYRDRVLIPLKRKRARPPRDRAPATGRQSRRKGHSNSQSPDGGRCVAAVSGERQDQASRCMEAPLSC